MKNTIFGSYKNAGTKYVKASLYIINNLFNVCLRNIYITMFLFFLLTGFTNTGFLHLSPAEKSVNVQLWKKTSRKMSTAEE